MKELWGLILMLLASPLLGGNAMSVQQQRSHQGMRPELRSVAAASEISGESRNPAARPMWPCCGAVAQTGNGPASLPALASNSLLRPTYANPDTFDTPSGYFRIHYTVTGDDSVYQAHVDENPADGVPDYVNRCSDVLDSVRAQEIDSMGYDLPPSDSGFPDNGGDGRYDVYLLNLCPLYFGYTQSEHYSPYPKATSFVVLSSDYSCFGLEHPMDFLRLTAAHQFFHAVQLGYDATEYEYGGDPPEFKPYWMELSAVWMEDMVYDETNDYLGYLPYFFQEPWLSLTTYRDYTDLHACGSCVWAFFLSERYEVDIIRKIWDKCAEVPGDNALDATGQVLQQPPYLSSLEDAFREFTVWNLFTNLRADTANFYSEGNLFDDNSLIEPVPGQYHTSYPAYPPSPLPHPPEHLASNYVYFIPDGANPDLQVGFFGDSTVNWQVSIVGYESGNPPMINQFDLDSLQNGNIAVYGWNSYSEVVLIAAVASRQPGEYEYGYAAVPFLCGDANGDGVINVADIVYLVNFLYRQGDPPDPMDAGDASCDGKVDVADVVYLVNYLYRDGDPPNC